LEEFVMGKVKLLSVSKASKRSVYTFEKNEEFLEFFGNFLNEFGIDYNEAKGDNVACDIEKGYDGCYHIANDIYDVDVAVGGKEIFLIIRTKTDQQIGISEKMFKYVEFKELK
jgi:hypothetical protein